MFKIKHALGNLIDIKFKGEIPSTVPIPQDKLYPETKEEAITALTKSAKNIVKEIQYMIGCIYFSKARILRPNTKTWWFKTLFSLLDLMEIIYNVLPIRTEAHALRTHNVNDDDIPF